ncbi:MAG TPA: nucleoside-diphosphate kinase [bacterium]
MIERTLLIIKPDAVKRNLIGDILHRMEANGYRITDIGMVRLSRDRAEIFYNEHKGKLFYEPLIDFMTEAPCVPVILEGEGAISGLRELIGATDPAVALPGTIRKDFGENGRRNAVHASDSKETAEKEIAFFFDSKPQG